tara:strand:+ start:600 stop:1631 length:1032 start_codon:yes stop_codon:yes gene_type:complete
MALYNLLIIIPIFLSIFVLSKKLKILRDDTSYSDHKMIGIENKSPVVLGGIYILIVFLIFSEDASIFLKLSTISITLLGLMSDRNILPSPRIRLILQISILLALSFYEGLEINDLRFDYFNFFLTNNLFNLFFVIFCLAILINGSNFLDGLNGLVSGYYLIVLLSLILLWNLSSNTIEMELNFITLIFFSLLIFFVFNIFGQVYLGDSGTYLISLLIGVYLIKFNLSNYFISPYYIALLLWYPAFENFFSITRRILKKNNVSLADNSHLHHLFFLFLKSKNLFPKNLSNSFCTIFLLMLNTPSMIAASFYASKSNVLLAIISLNIFLYLLAYYFFVKYFVNKK